VARLPPSSMIHTDLARFLLLVASGKLSRSNKIDGFSGTAPEQVLGRAALTLTSSADQSTTACALEGLWTDFMANDDHAKVRTQLMTVATDESPSTQPAVSDRQPASWWCQWGVLFNRAMLMLVRNWQRMATDAALVVVAGFYTGLLFVGLEYEGPACPPPCDMTSFDDLMKGLEEGRATRLIRNALEGGQDPFAFQAGIAVMAFALCGVIESLGVFGNMKETYYQEVSKGLSSSAIFFATDAVNLIRVLVTPVVFLVPYWVWVHGAGAGCAGFWNYYEVFLPLAFACSSLAYLISIVLPRSNAQMAVVVVVLVMMRIWDMPDMPWLRYFGFMRWAQEALYLEDYLCLAARAEEGASLTIGRMAAQLHDTTAAWNPNGFVEALAWLWGWGLFLRMLAMLCLMYKAYAHSK